jgi:pilus assembly protein Flp/PilA
VLSTLKTVLVDEDGATLVEYALVVALIAAVAIGVITTLGTNIKTLFTNVGNDV